jgi:3-dehydroquinate synthetase
MKNNKLTVKTKSKIYPVYFGNNILSTTGRLIKKKMPGVKKICIISDNRVPKRLLKKLTGSLRKYKIRIYKLPVSEKTKRLNIANKITEQLFKYY